MKNSRGSATVSLLMAGVAYAAPPPSPFNETPDWTSSDTPYSTGGALVDLDHDGWLDFVVANGNDIRRERLVVYYNNGDGTLPLTPDWLSSDTEYNGHLAVADVNGDGWMDVAVGLTLDGLGAPSARLYLNNEGILSSLPDWETPDQEAAFQVAFGDVNGDGRPDLAVGTGFPYHGSHRWHNRVYMNVDGALETTASWVSTDVWDYGDVLFCDVDDDGWLDLVGVGEKTDTWVYLNDEGTLSTTATWHTTDRADQFALMATYGDVDEDGLPDLIVTDNTQIVAGKAHRHDVAPDARGPSARGGAGGEVRRYDGLTGGLFTTTPIWSHFEGYGSAVALADLDADNDLDLATGGWWRAVYFFLNSSGAYPVSPTWQTTTGSVVEAIYFADIDLDGLRWPVDSFDVAPGVAQHLFQLTRQPIEGISEVIVDDRVLAPDEFTFDPVHGWVSIGPEDASRVTVRYVYTRRPDMAITNWDDTRGNFLFYNINDASRFGDLDGDNEIDLADVDGFALCYTGPGGGPVASDCDAGDADSDGDVDCDDWQRFESVWPGPDELPLFEQCTVQIPASSGWGLLVLGLSTLVAVTAAARASRERHANG